MRNVEQVRDKARLRALLRKCRGRTEVLEVKEELTSFSKCQTSMNRETEKDTDSQTGLSKAQKVNMSNEEVEE